MVRKLELEKVKTDACCSEDVREIRRLGNVMGKQNLEGVETEKVNGDYGVLKGATYTRDGERGIRVRKDKKIRSWIQREFGNIIL